jgi:hypothetical protein
MLQQLFACRQASTGAVPAGLQPDRIGNGQTWLPLTSRVVVQADFMNRREQAVTACTAVCVCQRRSVLLLPDNVRQGYTTIQAEA